MQIIGETYTISKIKMFLLILKLKTITNFKNLYNINVFFVFSFFPNEAIYIYMESSIYTVALTTNIHQRAAITGLYSNTSGLPY